MLDDTWFPLDEPVLEAVIAAFDSGPPDRFPPSVRDIAGATGFPPADVAHALQRLDGEYLSFRTSATHNDPKPWYVERVFPSARRVVGQWPSLDVLIGRLTTALQQVAEQAGDENTKGRARRAFEALGGLTKDIVVEVAAKMAEHQIGLS